MPTDDDPNAPYDVSLDGTISGRVGLLTGVGLYTSETKTDEKQGKTVTSGNFTVDGTLAYGPFGGSKSVNISVDKDKGRNDVAVADDQPLTSVAVGTNTRSGINFGASSGLNANGRISLGALRDMITGYFLSKKDQAEIESKSSTESDVSKGEQEATENNEGNQ